jgi:hypothetical protein
MNRLGKSKDDFGAENANGIQNILDEENNDSAESAHDQIDNDRAFRFLDFSESKSLTNSQFSSEKVDSD